MNPSRPWHRHYDPGVPAGLSIPSMPLARFLREAAGRHPDRACTIHRETSISFAEMDALTDRLAAALLELGLGRGARVGIFLPNLPEFVMAFYAILKAGGVVVATNPLYTPAEIEFQANDSGMEAAFVLDSIYEKIQSTRPRTGIRTLILIGDGLRSGPQAGDLRFDDLLAGPSRLPPDLEPDPADVALIQYSGGTTGTAKGVLATHRNLVANTLQFKAWMVDLRDGEETALLAIPLYHVYGMVCGMSLSVALAASMLLIPNPRDMDALLAGIEAHRPTYFPAVPTLYNAINNHPRVQCGEVALGSIKACISGSAPLMKTTKETFERLTGGHICEGYGLSEAPTATHCNPLRGVNKIGSIGLPLPGVDCRIVDPEDGETDLPGGEAGELLIRSPQVMAGYHNQPEETRLALRDGWLRTGDIARMDEDGYFYIVDRKKDLIKPGGFQVWPREVEQAIASHPAVLEVAVAGVPDDYRGETVKAWVVVKPGETVTDTGVREWSRERLAAYKVPSQVEFRSELPKSNVGKILRRQLVKEHVEQKRPGGP
jgi:long-chain acyl-CoA synthetase